MEDKVRLHQLYLSVTETQWEEDFKDSRPNAPKVSNYRVVVTTNKDAEGLKDTYNPKELTALETIAGIESETGETYLSSLEDMKIIMDHFNPPEEL